jgi:hypothetical protein
MSTSVDGDGRRGRDAMLPALLPVGGVETTRQGRAGRCASSNPTDPRPCRHHARRPAIRRRASQRAAQTDGRRLPRPHCRYAGCRPLKENEAAKGGRQVGASSARARTAAHSHIPQAGSFQHRGLVVGYGPDHG